MLDVWHMAAGTRRARGPCGVKGVLLRLARDARVACRALTIVESPCQRVAEGVAVVLGVGSVTVHAGHGAEEVAGAAAVRLLIPECRDPAIGQVRRVAHERKAEAVVVGWASGGIVQGTLEGVALEAHGERSVGIQSGEGGKADVGGAQRGLLHMCRGRAVTGLAVDAQRGQPGLVPRQFGTIVHLDLTPVAVLAVRKATACPEDPHRRPVPAFGQPQLFGDRLPTGVAAEPGPVGSGHPEPSHEGRIAEPGVPVLGVIERQETLRCRPGKATRSPGFRRPPCGPCRSRLKRPVPEAAGRRVRPGRDSALPRLPEARRLRPPSGIG